jgi:hypothetical protein
LKYGSSGSALGLGDHGIDFARVTRIG